MATPSKRQDAKALRSALVLLTSLTTSTAFTCDVSNSTAQYNATSEYLGCYNDSSVSILSSAKASTIAMTAQYCANFCGERGFGYAGIEFGTYV